MSHEIPPQRSGMPPWAKWSLFGCGGCLAVAVVTVIIVAVFVSRNLKFEQFNVTDKPDPPPTATAQQLLPPRVGAFTLQSKGKPTGSTRGWQGKYTAGARRVTLTVVPTSEARQNRGTDSPIGSALQRGGQNPNVGVVVSVNVGDRPTQIAAWQKPNWSFVVESEDKAAGEFARAYRPAGVL